MVARNEVEKNLIQRAKLPMQDMIHSFESFQFPDVLLKKNDPFFIEAMQQ